MFANLNGWHTVILLIVLLAMAAVVAVIVLIAVYASRRATASRGPQLSAQTGAISISERLAALDRLRDQRLVSDTEYEAKRADILGSL